MAEVVITYTPTPKQKFFHEVCVNEALFGGAAGGGKSKAIVMDAFARCLYYPKTHAYIFRRTYTELEDTVIKEAKASYPMELAEYNVGRHEMLLYNGSVVHFRHCASVADMYNYAGAEIHWLYLDELTSFEKDIYDFLKTRLRAKVELGIVPVVRCASNPGNIGHGWVKKYFVTAGPFMEPVLHRQYSEALGGEFEFTTMYIPALAMENPHITKEYILELERKPKALKEALLHGSWDAFEGQVFGEFVNLSESKDVRDVAMYHKRLNTHVIEPFEIPLTWPRYMSFDHGYSKPFSCGWWAMSPDGTLYRYKEWYGSNGQPNKGLGLTPRQIAEGIIKREREEIADNVRVIRIADPAIFDRSRGPSVADQMEPSSLTGASGVFFTKGDNTRLAGKMQVHERMRPREIAPGLWKPKMYVFKNCVDFIRTIPDLPYSLTDPEDVDSDAEDHIYDDTRYLFMYNPLPVSDKPPRKPKPYDPFEEKGDHR